MKKNKAINNPARLNDKKTNKNQQALQNKNQKEQENKKINPALNVKRTGRKRVNNDLPLLAATTKIRVNGFNQARILNRLNKENILIKNIKIVSANALEFNIRKKDNQKTFAILQDMCYNYSIVAESGTLPVLMSCIRHIGLLAGALVFIVSLALSSQMVWRISIDGNDALDSKLIMQRINQCGVKVGSFKSKVDASQITRILRDMDGIAESTVEVVGTTVKVKVIEQKDYIPPQSGSQTDEQTGGEIVSRFDAEVTRINVKSGTANVKLGDRIAAGSTLIKGERLSTTGEVIEEVVPRGSVYGLVSFSEKHIFSTTEQILMRTGKKKAFTSLSLLGLTIGEKKAMANWDKEVSTAKMGFIPIKIKRTTYYETKLVTKERDMDEYVKQLKNQALLNNVIKAGGSEVQTVTTLTNIDGGLVMLNIYIVAEVLLN